MKEENVIKTVLQHIDALDNSEKLSFAHRMIFEIVNWSALNYYESMGLLEGVKMNYHETWSQINLEEEEDRRNVN